MQLLSGRFRNLSLRGRGIESVTRPMTARARASLFDHLAHHPDVSLGEAVIVDGFCGTGALGLEALSRGAREGFFMDNSAKVINNLRLITHKLPDDVLTHCFVTDLTASIVKPDDYSLADIIFLTPPWGSGLGATAAANLRDGGWLTDEALLVVEVKKNETCLLRDDFEFRYQRVIGDHKLLFFIPR